MRWLDLADPRLIGLAPSHLAVAAHLVRRAADEPALWRAPSGAMVTVRIGGVVVAQDRFADDVGVTRAVVRRALENLQTAGWLSYRTIAGHTLVELSVDRTGKVSAGSVVSEKDPDTIQGLIQPLIQGSPPITAATSDASDGDSTAVIQPLIQGSIHGGFSDPGVADDNGSDTNELPDVTHSHDPAERISEVPLASHAVRDLDLLPESDLRSGSEISPSERSLSTPAAKGKREKAAPEPPPPYAFRAADRMRSRVLGQWPGHALQHKAWTETAPTRVAWAREFRRMIEIDKRAMAEVGAVVVWLFEGQTGEARFVVQSPDALRKKYDRILAQMQREAAEKAAGKPATERKWKEIP